MLVGLGWVLAWQQERSAQAVLLPLTPFVPASDAWAVLQPHLPHRAVTVHALLGQRPDGTGARHTGA